jgi:adenylosuccinate lyase
MENIALWHERDISHSSTERIMMPDATIGLHYMLVRMQGLLSGLNVYPQNMQINLDKTKDVIFSGTLLLSLVDKGLTRENSYALMQKLAFEAREKKISLEEVALKSDEMKKYLSEKEIRRDCDIKTHFKNVDFIFKRVFKNK